MVFSVPEVKHLTCFLIYYLWAELIGCKNSLSDNDKTQFVSSEENNVDTSSAEVQ